MDEIWDVRQNVRSECKLKYCWRKNRPTGAYKLKPKGDTKRSKTAPKHQQLWNISISRCYMVVPSKLYAKKVLFLIQTSYLAPQNTALLVCSQPTLSRKGYISATQWPGSCYRLDQNDNLQPCSYDFRKSIFNEQYHKFTPFFFNCSFARDPL